MWISGPAVSAPGGLGSGSDRREIHEGAAVDLPGRFAIWPVPGSEGPRPRPAGIRRPADSDDGAHRPAESRRGGHVTGAPRLVAGDCCCRAIDGAASQILHLAAPGQTSSPRQATGRGPTKPADVAYQMACLRQPTFRLAEAVDLASETFLGRSARILSYARMRTSWLGTSQ